MATTIDYASDCGAKVSDYQTTMPEKPSEAIDFKFCPLLVAAWLSAPLRPEDAETMKEGIKCHGSRCAWYDQTAERCAVLSLDRNK